MEQQSNQWSKWSQLTRISPFIIGAIPRLEPLDLDGFIDDLEEYVEDGADSETDVSTHPLSDTDLGDLIEGAIHCIETEVLQNPLIMTEETADTQIQTAVEKYFHRLLSGEVEDEPNSENNSTLLGVDYSHHIDALVELTLDTLYHIHTRRSHPQRWSAGGTQSRASLNGFNNSIIGVGTGPGTGTGTGPGTGTGTGAGAGTPTGNIDTTLSTIRQKNALQPAQRTPEWYNVRYNLISASNAWLALGSEANRNQLIKQKCCGLGDGDGGRRYADPNSPLQWGQRYEPVAILIYEDLFDATIEQFGCIPHSRYPFIGASPDGINVRRGSHTYGRMLEIKNVVSRELTGIPKKDYWVQTQMQLEVCDLEECDLFECKFAEYESSESYWASVRGDDGVEPAPPYCGIIVEFSADGETVYEYAPLDVCKNEEAFDEWAEDVAEKRAMDSNGKSGKQAKTEWIRNFYWRLEEYSCVLIERNRAWFEAALPLFESLWDTVMCQREMNKDVSKIQVVKSDGEDVDADATPTPTPTLTPHATPISTPKFGAKASKKHVPKLSAYLSSVLANVPMSPSPSPSSPSPSPSPIPVSAPTLTPTPLIFNIQTD